MHREDPLATSLGRIIPSNTLCARSRCRTIHRANSCCAPRGSGGTRRRGREPRGEWELGGRRGSGEAMRCERSEPGHNPQVEPWRETRTKRGKRVKENCGSWETPDGSMRPNRRRAREDYSPVSCGACYAGRP